MSKSMKNTVVIGDYYNDLEIMREAGYAWLSPTHRQRSRLPPTM